MFIVGSGVTCPTSDCAGVKGVSAIVEAIRELVVARTSRTEMEDVLSSFEQSIRQGGSPYIQAFEFMKRRFPDSQNEMNAIVRQAVLDACARVSIERMGPANDAELDALTSAEGAMYWHLRPGVEALGQLLARFPRELGSTLLTTNFDPLIQVAYLRAGGGCYLRLDGTKGIPEAIAFQGQTRDAGVQVAHLHGYWLGSATLHTRLQMAAQVNARPLRDWIRRMLLSRTVVVVGYGGWDDVVMAALDDAIESNSEEAQKLEVHWALFGPRSRASDSIV
jgi:hypothetical protein